MQVIVIHQFGDPKLLQVEEVPTPQPGRGEALIEVKAAGINPSDVKNIQGAMHSTTLPRIPGRDFAGTVVKGPPAWLGKDVWGTGGDVGFTRDGSHAQFMTLPVEALTARPAQLSMEAAGSAGLVYVTAWSALVTAAGITKSDTVLVIGAGGVGSAALQIARERGGKVIAAVRSDGDFASARENGAEEVINTSAGNLADQVRALTKGCGADVVFDTSGHLFDQAVEAAALQARVPVITAPGDGKVTFNLRTLYRKQLRVVGIDTVQLNAEACADLLAAMAPPFAAGRFKASPGQARALAAAPQAYEEVVQGKGRFYLLPNRPNFPR